MGLVQTKIDYEALSAVAAQQVNLNHAFPVNILMRPVVSM